MTLLDKGKDAAAVGLLAMMVFVSGDVQRDLAQSWLMQSKNNSLGQRVANASIKLFKTEHFDNIRSIQGWGRQTAP